MKIAGSLGFLKQIREKKTNEEDSMLGVLMTNEGEK